jgi:glyoxylase-like metal-dependent hydrolase (beta-lactamase superfamily II)
VITLAAHNASEWTGPTGNNTYLLPGRVPALVDAGVGHPAHLDSVAAALDGSHLALVLITHGHSDHVKGVPALLERWPHARVAAAADLEGIEAVEAGDTRLRVIPTPGHSADHVCLLDESTRDLFCGDLARSGGTIVIPGSKGGNLRQYLASLRLVRDLRPRRLLPGHGPVIDDPDEVIERYLRHRQEREDQIVEALAAGPATAAELAARIYGPRSASIARAAEESVLAHLVKLQEEGHAVVDADLWRRS